ncbi:MAG: transglycosylase domain-containing protein [Clostridia bacterium]|nr:transglycosylase domain-containing protein [Clostridia bacterium]
MAGRSRRSNNNFWSKLKAFFQSKPVHIFGIIFGVIFKIVLTVVLIGVIAACIGGVVLTIYVFNTFANSQEMPDISRIMENGTSIVYTQNSNGDWVESQRLEGINRIWTDLPEIPDNLQKAVVAIEDERFYEHDGVDWKRTAAAVVNKLLHNSNEFGGSTITQQLIKVVSEDDDATIERKIREIFRAIEMERDYYTKDQILEAYLNILPMSDGVVGVGAAANYYFGKDVSKLTLAECAVIAGITNSPSYYDPYDHPAHARERQHVILQKMHELGFISDDEYIQAYGEELHFKNSAKYVDVQDYYVDQLIEDIIADLQEEYGYNYNYAEQLVFFGGLRIYSYENTAIQGKIEAIFRDDSNFPDIEGEEEDPNAAIFIMDYDGRVIATVGGRGQKTGNRSLNRSTQSRRQPGSAIKPLATYAPAIDLDIVNYSTLVRDAPIQLPDGDLWPSNFGMGVGDHGWVTVQYALEDSFNTVPVRILQEMGLSTSYEFLTEKLHFTSLEPEDEDYAPLGLGGFTYGVTVREMAAGFQIFGNGGYCNKPYTYEKILLDDDILLEHKTAAEPAIDPASATVMNKLLQKVFTQGTATAIRGDWPGMEVFAKTGTTNDNKDSYFAAGTPYYVGAVWMGYDNNDSLSEWQRSIAKVLWSQCMRAAHEGLEPTSFDEWGDVEGHYYGSNGCVTSGGGNWGWYKSSNIPTGGSNTLGDISYGEFIEEETTTSTLVSTTAKTKAEPETTAPDPETTAPEPETTAPEPETTAPDTDITEPPDTTETISPDPETTLPAA